MKKIVSYGGGLNSTAMLIYLAENNIDVDAILFADTGGEKPATYEYIKYFNKWLSRHGLKIEVVKYKTKHGVELSLEQDVLNNNTLPSIAFGWKTCSQKFKILPQTKWIESIYPGEEIIHLIGYDITEQRRVKENPLPLHENKYPLIELGWDRKRCEQEILLAGLCLPEKSSCFFCPNMKKHEILSLPVHLQIRVMEMESNATKVAELKGLGRQYAWTDLINADQKQIRMFNDIDMFDTPCECID